MSAPRDPYRQPLESRVAHRKRGRVEISPDWIFAIVLIIGLVIMLTAIGTRSSRDNADLAGSRAAVGMTPTDRGIMFRFDPCSPEKVAGLSLRTVEPENLLWEATADEPQERYVFVIGQAPTTFVETVALPDQLPRGALLEAAVETEEAIHSVQFFFADLLPDLWHYAGIDYPNDGIGEVIDEASSCQGAVATSTSGRRVLMIVGFFIAAAAGAGLLSRRLVSSDL